MDLQRQREQSYFAALKPAKKAFLAWVLIKKKKRYLTPAKSRTEVYEWQKGSKSEAGQNVNE